MLPTSLSAVLAANGNGGPSTFPYCDCDEGTSSLVVSSFRHYEEHGSYTIEFQLNAGSSLGRAKSSCTQDVKSIEINSFASCKWSKVQAMMNGAPVVSSFENSGTSIQIANVQVLKLSKLYLSYTKLASTPVNISISLGGKRSSRSCTHFSELLNTTATPDAAMSIALFSSDSKCCPLVTPTAALSPPAEDEDEAEL
eukprot:gene21180-28080_t